jgi:hypothetical protein
VLTTVERRLNDFSHVLCSVGRHEQCFGATIEINILWVGKNRAQQCTNTSTAWLTSDDRVQVFAQPFCVRALAASL